MKDNFSDSDSDEEYNDNKANQNENKDNQCKNNKESNNIPRPKQAQEIYINKDKKTTFQTNPDENNVPHCLSYYKCQETINSNPRLIRCTLNRIPKDPKVLQDSSLIFGLYFQPFAELRVEDNSIPLVKSEENDILRCNNCKAFVNVNFEFKHSKNGISHIFECNLCKYENKITPTTEGFKDNYFTIKNKECLELNQPTVDFEAPRKYLEKDLLPRYVFLIDYSMISIKIDYITYILNSICTVLSNWSSLNNNDISIVLVDEEKVYFFRVDNSVKMFVVDGNDPFLPISANYLFFKSISSNLDMLFEKIHHLISLKLESPKKNYQKKIKIGLALNSCIDLLKEFGGRVITFFTTDIEFNLTQPTCNNEEDNSWLLLENVGTDYEKHLYNSKNNYFLNLAKVCVKHFIVVDSFFFSNFIIDLSAFLPICNITSGSVFLYQLDIDHEGKTNKSSKEFRFQLEKLFYDFSQIFTRKNYYQIGFNLRTSSEIDLIETIGQFGVMKKVNSFHIPGCSSDFNFTVILKLNSCLKIGQEISFQLASIYNDNFNNRYIRTINYKIIVCEDFQTILKSVDICALTKITLIKGINLMKESSLKNARKYLENIVVELLFYYRKINSLNTDISQLILPENVKLYPLYIHSFMKKPIFLKNKSNTNITEIIYLIHKIIREPIYFSLKYLYPRLYRLDNIPQMNNYVFYPENEYDKYKIQMIRGIGANFEEEDYIIKPLLVPLSYDFIDMDNALLLDNGECLFLFIFFDVEIRFLSDVFNVKNFEQLIILEQENIEMSDYDLNNRVLNIINQVRKDNFGYTQPLVILTMKEEDYKKEFLLQFLIEDFLNGEKKYYNFLVDIHDQIIKKIKGK